MSAIPFLTVGRIVGADRGPLPKPQVFSSQAGRHTVSVWNLWGPMSVMEIPIRDLPAWMKTSASNGSPGAVANDNRPNPLNPATER